ncbi:MAG TPA: trypsin-like peptidase domain-containing protein, partial [Blastocatellia bacterium]|nr:trypsin-like peptidase domain-containing protein [Blastocatellia bacterium]
MFDRGDESVSRWSRRAAYSSQNRTIALLIGVCCLTTGIAIGSLWRDVAGAREEDNRLAISSDNVTPDSLSAIFSRVADNVEPSVVHIKVSEGEIATRQGTGSGVIVNPAGFIITNNHVISRASKIKVKLFDGREFEATIIGRDSGTDLAVVKIDARETLPSARMGDSDKLRVGDWVLAIGSPFGLEQTVTAGIISAKDRVTDPNLQSAFQQFLQTDAAINPGNSGGPLVNIAGEVIGINTQIATNNGFNNGIGLALPSSTAVDVYNQLVTSGRVRRGFLGIRPVELPPQLARMNRVPDNQGVLVRDLTAENTPAGRSGIQSGDIIISISGQRVKNVRELIRRIASLPVGSKATIVYIRKGEQLTANVTLDEREDAGDNPIIDRDVPFDPRSLPERTPRNEGKSKVKPGLGINIETLTPELARIRGLEGARGVYVVGVEPGSIAYEELMPEDLIVEVNLKPIVMKDEFLKATKDLKSGDDLVLKVLRKERGPV